MATNFATETLKAVTAKIAASAASDISGSNSTVAEFKAQDSTTEITRQPDTQHGSQTEDQAGDTAASHGAKAFPTLSESALTELKAAYAQVESALAEAAKTAAGDQTSVATGGDAAKDATSQDTATQDAAGAKTDAQADAHTDVSSGRDSHPASLNPLVKVLADATGETTAEVKDVLQQVHAVLRQEHVQQAGHSQAGQSGDQAAAHGNHGGASTPADQPATQPTDSQPATGQPTDKAALWHDRQDQQADTTTDTSTSTGNSTAPDAKGGSGSTTTTASAGDSGATDGVATGTGASDGSDDGDAGATLPSADDTTLWHDRLTQQNGASAEAGTGPHGGSHGANTGEGGADNASADGSNAMWHHLVAQDGAQPALDADVVAAVEHFTEVLQDLHLTPTHGHTADQTHLDTAA
jgi:hypothetical protein